MKKQLLKPDNAILTILWTIGKKQEVAKRDEVNFKIPQVPVKKKDRGKVILQFNPDAKERVKLYGEPVILTDLEYNFLRFLAENPGVPIDGNLVYLELYTEYGQASPDELYVIKSRLLKKLQTQFGEKRVPYKFIYLKPREGFILNLNPWEVEFK